ncbi:MAG: hypothetical protein H6R17_3613 [Proteobacteria bacterium]|nr:hypothetical protein [Pseudomonadota bacterium]
MPLSEFVRYLNAQKAPTGSGGRSTTPFVAENGQVYVHFAKLRLESFYSPIVAIADGELHGHAAGLNAFGIANRQLLEPDAVFVLPSDDAEFSYLDRLVRTLHALNYLIYAQRRSRGSLLLRVHPRHVASVSADHGLAFEEVLRTCGLMPAQITLEIEIDGVDDQAQLVGAVANYKSRGYGIAVGRFGRREVNFALLQEIAPAIVKLDPLLLAATPQPQRLVDRLHELGAQVMIEGADTAARRERAQVLGVDLLQVSNPLRD